VSDGPHRSLNMNRSWKRLAECADNEAFSVADIAGAFIPALEQSCREEVPDALLQELKRIFGDQQRPLFEEQKVEEIAALRSTVAGFPLGCALIDGAVRTACDGTLGTEPLVEAMTQALLNRATRASRQVEEHYYRNSTDQRTQNVRDRMERALKAAALDNLARQILTGTVYAPPRSRKRTDLDDGVQL
jgi:hypothetical protein